MTNLGYKLNRAGVVRPSLLSYKINTGPKSNLQCSKQECDLLMLMPHYHGNLFICSTFNQISNAYLSSHAWQNTETRRNLKVREMEMKWCRKQEPKLNSCL